MRMTANHLPRDGIDHVGEAEQRLLSRHLRVIDDLEQEIAELILEPVEILARDRVGDLVSLLDGVGSDASRNSASRPTDNPIGVAQARHDGEKIVERMLFAAFSHRAALRGSRRSDAQPRQIHPHNQYNSRQESFRDPDPRFA